MTDDKALATQKTAATLVESYVKALRMVKEAYQQLDKAHQILEEAYGQQAYMDVTARRQHSEPMKAYADVEEDLKRRAWKRILAISQINKMLSIKRAEEMSNKLNNGELPEITLNEVLSMLQSVSENANDFVKEAAAEFSMSCVPLPTDAIGTTENGAGETEYFSFVCYKNHNLHLKFKRMDLVAKLNAVNGDPNILKGE